MTPGEAQGWSDLINGVSVAVLLAVLLGLGVGLYLYGLQYLYPTS